MLRILAMRLTAAAATALALSSSASALLIDNFTVADTNTGTIMGQETATSVRGPAILGGWRNDDLLLKSGASIALNVNSGKATYTEAAVSDGQLFFVWDGQAGAVINQTGLGGVDLTAGGTQDALSVQFLANTVAVTAGQQNLAWLIHTDVNNYSIAYFAAPAGASTQIIPFASFVPHPGGTGANFHNIGSVALFSDGPPTGQNIQFGAIQTTQTPEPATGALLALGLLGLARRPR